MSKLSSWLRSWFTPSHAKVREIDGLKREITTSVEQCHADALQGDTGAHKCLQSLDETLSAQTMKMLREVPTTGKQRPQTHTS